ncbi:MAG: galactose-1-phosphate uridylyltransferase [Rubrobacteraceae bacterium]
MNELRWNPTAKEWISYATHRQDRTFHPPPEYCPLCPTKNEDDFPTEVPKPSYQIVVFENKFPSFVPKPEDPQEAGNGLTPTAPGQGVCEVVLYTDDHYATLAEMDKRHIKNLVDVWADRYLDLGSREFVDYVFIFENKGEVIGVTLSHPHGQIYAYPFVPPRPARELEAAGEHHREKGSCLHCELLSEEHEDGRRVLIEGQHFSAFIPFYARFPYEAHLYAHRCVPSIAELSEEERWDLAGVLKGLLSGYDELFGFSLPYMMAMHQAPTDGGSYEGVAHFHVEFYPPNRTSEKLKYLAGSETGAGVFVMDVKPEDTAAELREKIEGAAS